MEIGDLIKSIQSVHEHAQKLAVQKVNSFLTIRNWLIGAYLFHFEQKGQERANFGEKLYRVIEKDLKEKGIKGLSFTNLHLFKNFYLNYPQFFQTVSEHFSGIDNSSIIQTLSEQLYSPEKADTVHPKLKTKSSPTESVNDITLPPDTLISRLSFSHFIELLKADTELKRVFYEVQAVKNNWSVRELKRAMDTLVFERTGMSGDKASVIAKAKDEVISTPKDLLKNPFILEFLDLEEKPEFSEHDLEQAIINHLQHFLMELGRGFCFEARQKRITFDNEHYYIDLVFYHRILKCHVLIDLKIGAFNHADAGQMNVYLNYYKDQEMTAGDNPPVGIILCASKNDSLLNMPQVACPRRCL